MKRLLTICAVTALVLAVSGLVQAGNIASDPDYKASTDLSIGPVTTVHLGDPDYELTGFGISAEFQINLLYQAGILDSDIDNINHYWDPMGWTYNFGDNEEYILNVSATGGLTIYEFDGMAETPGGPEIKWTLTAWHQTILAGDIIDNGNGTITLQVLPVGTYRPFVNDPPVNNVEVFDGDLDCEVLGYTFTGAISGIGDGSVLSINLAPAPTEVWVDDDFDNSTPGWGTTHFATIQDGIDAVAGSTVNVAAGTYPENVVIGKENLTLQSASNLGAIIRPTITPAWPGAVIYISADGVTVDGFEIDGTTVCNNGIYGWETSGLTIKNNKIHGATNAWDGCGILLMSWGNAGTVHDNLIQDNEVYDTERMGIMVMEYGSTWTITSNITITGNTVHDVWNGGLGDHGGGIQINGAKNCSITDNLVYDSDDRGIYMFCSASGNTITGNTIRNNSIGVQIWISGEGGSSFDWQGETATSPEVHYNEIYGNTTGAISTNMAGENMVLDATLNWWGDASGPYHPTEWFYEVFLLITNPDGLGNEVSDYVLYLPWIGMGGFVTGGGTIWSEAGNYELDPDAEGQANFGFVSKYKKGKNVPDGSTNFVFQAGDLHFHSSSYDWLVVTGSNYAMFKGTGTINDSGDYKFMLWAGDGGKGDDDTFRIKIWEEDEIGLEDVVYDNGMDQVIDSGSIIVHTK